MKFIIIRLLFLPLLISNVNGYIINNRINNLPSIKWTSNSLKWNSNLKFNRRMELGIGREEVQYNDASLEKLEEDEEATELVKAPSIKELLMFGVPTLGSWLLQPVLSLIDSSVVGMCSSLFELAALGPGIAWCDSTAYLFNFMGVATTNLYVNAMGTGNTKKAQKTICEALVISLGFGIFLGLVQVLFASPVMRLLCGHATEAVPYAVTYVYIRAWGAPIAIPMIVAQAAFLANKDSMTPLKSVIIGALVNLVGDLILTKYYGMGLAGAAIATAASQYVALFYLVWKVVKIISARPLEESDLSIALDDRYGNDTVEEKKDVATLLEGTSSASYPVNSNINSNNRSDNVLILYIHRLQERARILNAKIKTVYQPPTIEGMKSFMSFCGPLSFVLLMKSVLWSYTTVAASTGGVTELAAHQITINFFLFFAIFGDVMSQLMQTFLPALHMKAIDDAKKETEVEKVSEIDSNDDSSNSNISSGINTIRSTTTAILQERENTPAALPAYAFQKTVAGKEGETLFKRILKIAITFAVMNSLLASFLPNLTSRFFTKTVEVLANMRNCVPFLMCAVVLHAPMAALEGSLIATRDLKFIVLAYIFGGTGFLSYQTWVRLNNLGTRGVWRGMALYQTFRILLFTWRTRNVVLRPSHWDYSEQLSALPEEDSESELAVS